MDRARQIRFRGEAAGNARAVALLEAPGDVALDHRGIDRSLVMKCPDGCGANLTVNLDPRSGKAWRCENRNGKLTLYPSVWRDDGCGAHFILWRDWLIWGDSYDEHRWSDAELIESVDTILHRQDDFVQANAIAEELGIIPWEVVWACQALVKQGRAETNKQREFRALKNPPPKSSVDFGI